MLFSLVILIDNQFRLVLHSHYDSGLFATDNSYLSRLKLLTIKVPAYLSTRAPTYLIGNFSEMGVYCKHRGLSAARA